MNFSALSWNICWGCMSSDNLSKYDLTAAKLAIFCEHKKEETGKNVCLNNVASFLKTKTYDIIALQESKNWKEIYKHVNKRYSYVNYTISHPVSGANVDITTFYGKQFKIHGAYFGNLATGDIRPYQYILFEHISSKKQFYFINLHNGHLISKNFIEKKFQSNTRFIKGEDNMDVVVINETLTLNGNPISVITKSKIDNIPIIMGGDFNDHGKYNYWETGIRINKKILRSENVPPLTCCTPVKNKYVWLGAPSIIYNPNLRKKILDIDLYFLFDITTFSSTACVGANANNNKDLNLCTTLDTLNKKCNSDNFRSHMAKSGKAKHFLTNFNEVKKIILKEQREIENDETEEPYQRYNEILTYFFPWEIFGIEIGTKKEDAQLFHDKIVVERNKLILYYETLNFKKIIELTNDVQYEMSNPWFDNNNFDYLLIKYLKTYFCKKGTLEEGFIRKVVKDIIANLHSPVLFYEYGREQGNNKFTLLERNKPTRSTEFELFTQTASKDFITHIKKYTPFESTLNLSSKKENGKFDYTKFCNKNECPLICRSLLIETQNKKTYGTVNIDDFIIEMFQGRLSRDWASRGLLNLVVNPATVIYSQSNVILCSQIFDRDFNKNKKIPSPTTYAEYFKSLDVGKRTTTFNNDIKYGDYFITTKDVIILQENTIPQEALDNVSYKTNPTSDHLPVEIQFKLFSTSSTPKKTQRVRRIQKNKTQKT